MTLRQLLAAVVLGGVALAAPAAEATAPAPARDASVDQLVDRLAPPAAASTTRSLRNIAPQARQIDLVVQFDFDSTRLQAPSQPQLQRLAEAMHNPRLAGTRFKVQGHTDATGSARYNAALSARRAQAVADFLQANGVGAERLQAEGKGATELLDPARPDSPDNRRVRIVAMEPSP